MDKAQAVTSFCKPPREKFMGKIREKELVRSYQVYDLETLHSYKQTPMKFIDCRLYMGRSNNASAVYCALWTFNSSGTGSAGGYGYHKQSAAVNDAILSAGYTMAIHFGGSGEQAIRDALTAIAVHEGCKKPFIVESFA